MDLRVIAQHGQRSYPIAWIGLQPDHSVSVGLSDRAFVSPHFQTRMDLFNIDNRVTVKYLVPQSTAALRSVQNPHLTFHPPITFHLRENRRVRVFEGIADVDMILEADGQMPWVRFVSRPIQQMPESGPSRPNSNIQVIAIPVSTADSSVGLSIDFVRLGTINAERGLVDHFEDWGNIRLHIFCEELAGQAPTLSWYHQS